MRQETRVFAPFWGVRDILSVQGPKQKKALECRLRHSRDRMGKAHGYGKLRATAAIEFPRLILTVTMTITIAIQ